MSLGLPAGLRRHLIVGVAAASLLPTACATQPVASGGDDAVLGRLLADGPVAPDGVFTGEVTRISDGDTLWVEVTDVGASDLRRGERYKLRLLRIDTPEIAHDPEPAECFGDEATALLTTWAPIGSSVRAAYDVEHQDRFGRELVHAWTSDGTWLNGMLLALGAAEAITIRPNDGYGDLPYDLEEAARHAGRGLWGACT